MALRSFLQAPWRSLAAKLTLAFLLIGLIGALLVALLVGLRTRTEFDRFLSERDRAVLLDALSDYYASHSSWQGVGELLAQTRPLDFYSRDITLVDADGVVVLASSKYRLGQRLANEALQRGSPVELEGRMIGTVLFPFSQKFENGERPFPPDVSFLRRVTWAAGFSALIAGLIALVVGGLLARTLTRPVRELIAATHDMAEGRLGLQVAVRSRDEIGELASAFNQMSSDLARASQLRKQMTADLAHDLRTPLSILRGYTEGLKDGRLQGGSPIYAIMHDEVEHLQRLVDDLRVLSLADAGELPLNRRAVDPAALLERTALAYIVQAEHQGIALQVENSGTGASVLADTDRMTQVLNNLVSNALRHTERGAIMLATYEEGGQVVLQVRDSGSGIAAQDLPFIFDRFYRADKARQRADSSSSGLGLAIAKAIVEAHAGTIRVESVEGLGTTFSIRLPVASGLKIADSR